MNETTPPGTPSEGPSEAQSRAAAHAAAQAAAQAERRAAPVPPRGPASGPAPYQPYPPFPPYPPSQSRPASAPFAGRRRERAPVAPGVVAIGGILLVVAIVMAAGFLFVGVLQGMAWAAGPAQATDTRTFTVTGAPTLSLDVSAGNVQIAPGADGQVTVTLTKQVQAITRTAAQQALAAISLDATQSGDSVRVRVRQPGLDGFPTWITRKVELTVTVPTSANLDLTMSAGNLDVTGVTGTLTGRVSAGNLKLNDMTVTGDSSLHVSAGNVEYSGSLAPNASLDVHVTAGNVDIVLPRTTSTHVQASVTAGNLSVEGWPNVNASRSGNGSVSVDLNPAPTSTLSIQATAGNVTVQPGA